MRFTFPEVPGNASSSGRRKFRAYPAFTVTTSPRCPSPFTSSVSMTFIGRPPESGVSRSRSEAVVLLSRRGGPFEAAPDVEELVEETPESEEERKRHEKYRRV